MIDVNVGMEGDVVVLDVAGNIVASTIDELKAQVNKLIDKNFITMMIDLSKVSFMDSSGLGCCMALHKTLSDKSGAIVFVRPSEAVSKIFRITRADQKISVAATRIDGLKLIAARAAKG